MSRTIRLSDEAIRTALTPVQDVQAPMDLGDAIWEHVIETPQRRRGVWASIFSPQMRLVLQLAVVLLLLLGLVLGMLAVISRPTVRASVTTYHGGPERTGIMPGPGPAGIPTEVWETDGRGAYAEWSPAVVDGTVYVGDQGGYVTAVDEATGVQHWQVSVGAAINCAITVADGEVIVGDDAGVLHVLDADTGTGEWTFLAQAPIHGSVAVVDGVAYFGTLDGTLYALDLDTRALRWPAVQTPGPISRAVAVANGIVYAGSGGSPSTGNGTLDAYDARGGDPIWSMPLEPGNTSTPTVSGGRVFVAGGLDSGSDHNVFAFDAATGERAWPSPFAAPSKQILLLGAVAGGHVYVTGTDGTLYVLDAANGVEVWDEPIHSSLTPNAAIVGTTLYVTSDDRKVHAFDIASHVELWSVPVPGTPSAPTVIDRSIFLTTSFGKVLELR